MPNQTVCDVNARKKKWKRSTGAKPVGAPTRFMPLPRRTSPKGPNTIIKESKRKVLKRNPAGDVMRSAIHPSLQRWDAGRPARRP